MEESGLTSVRPPLGRYPARLDEKGRLKLPSVFHDYFKTFPENRLFVTSLDGRIGRIYSIGAWEANLRLLDAYTEDPQAKQDLLFNAQDLGAEAEMDTQGRVTVNSDLRKELDLQGQELHLFAVSSHVQIVTEAIYQERRRRARPAGADNVDKLERFGLK